MRRCRVRSNHLLKAKSFLFRKLADCTIATCEQPKTDCLEYIPQQVGSKADDPPRSSRSNLGLGAGVGRDSQKLGSGNRKSGPTESHGSVPDEFSVWTR